MATPSPAYNQALADRTLAANTAPRFRQLDELERYVTRTQYDGRPDYFSDDKPLFERKPCIKSPMVGSAIRSHVAMVLGDARFPRLTSDPDEDDEGEADDEDDTGLSEDESKTLDRFIGRVSDQVGFPVAMRRLLKAAMGNRTSVAIACLRNGKLAVDTTLAKWCKPEFDPADPAVVTKLEIRYPYIEHYFEESGGAGPPRPAVRCLIYRRIIDATNDTTFLPAKGSESGGEPDSWQPDPVKTIKHDLGFCPVVWYPFLKEEGSVAEIDGVAIHQHLLAEIVGLDFALSQRHRATLYTTDPLMLEIGVEPGFNPTQTGQKANLWIPGDQESMKTWQTSRPSGNTVRRRAPGQAYQYPSNTQVSYLTLPAGALDAAIKNASELEVMCSEALCWVPTDPKDLMSGATLSGKALEWLHKKQIDFDREIRTNCADSLILPVMSMLLRIVAKKGAGGGIYIDGLKAAMKVLSRFEREQLQDDKTTKSIWMTPQIRCAWPPFFAPSDTDAKTIGDNVRADVGAGLIKKATAIKKLAVFYDITNPAQYAEDMEAEEAKKTAELHAANALLAPPGSPGAAPPGAAPGRPAPAGSPALPRAAKPQPKPAPPVAALPPGRMFGGGRTRNAPAPPVT